MLRPEGVSNVLTHPPTREGESYFDTALQGTGNVF